MLETIYATVQTLFVVAGISATAWSGAVATGVVKLHHKYRNIKNPSSEQNDFLNMVRRNSAARLVNVGIKHGFDQEFHILDIAGDPNWYVPMTIDGEFRIVSVPDLDALRLAMGRPLPGTRKIDHVQRGHLLPIARDGEVYNVLEACRKDGRFFTDALLLGKVLFAKARNYRARDLHVEIVEGKATGKVEAHISYKRRWIGADSVRLHEGDRNPFVIDVTEQHKNGQLPMVTAALYMTVMASEEGRTFFETKYRGHGQSDIESVIGALRRTGSNLLNFEKLIEAYSQIDPGEIGLGLGRNMAMRFLARIGVTLTPYDMRKYAGNQSKKVGATKFPLINDGALSKATFAKFPIEMYGLPKDDNYNEIEAVIRTQCSFPLFGICDESGRVMNSLGYSLSQIEGDPFLYIQYDRKNDFRYYSATSANDLAASPGVKETWKIKAAQAGISPEFMEALESILLESDTVLRYHLGVVQMAEKKNVFENDGVTPCNDYNNPNHWKGMEIIAPPLLAKMREIKARQAAPAAA